MPWKNDPGWLTELFSKANMQGLLTFVFALFASGVGAMAKIADEVKSGERRKFFSRSLWLEIPSLVMAALATIALAAWLELPAAVTGGVGTWMGWAGPKAADAAFSRFMRHR